MRFSSIVLTIVLEAVLAIVPAAIAGLGKTVGFQQVSVPDPEGKPVAMAIWYPSDAPAADSPLGMFSHFVATNAPMSGKQLPLILISHGTSGSLASHYDTALALAEAGFVAAAISHTGDSFADQSYAGNRIDLIDRPRQIRVALDYLLGSWKDHAQLDPERIGMFGFSLGGFTTLVAIGGTPDLARMARLCATKPEAPECVFVKQRQGDQLEQPANAPEWVHDPRIKAAVIAAPAVGFLFEGGGLKRVSVPVELWRASNDHQAPDEWNSGIVRKELPKPPDEHVVPGVDHFVFLAPCSQALTKAAPLICEDPPGFSREEFHEGFNRALIAFFSTELKR
jgi:predicted dienelactone hydrolase